MRLAPALVVALVLAASPPSLAAAAAPAPPPAPVGLARFTAHPRFVEAALSPKGTFLAVVMAEGGRRALAFIKLATREVCGGYNPGGSSAVGDFYWVNDERVVVELVDHDGTLAAPVRRGELYAVNAVGGHGRMVFGYRAGEMQTGSNIRKAQAERAWARVVDTLRHDDKNILIATRSMDEAGERQVRLRKLDVYTGRTSEVAVSPMPEAWFMTDADGRLRLAVAEDAAFDSHFFLREEAERSWRELKTLAGFNRFSTPVGFGADGQSVEVVEGHEGVFGLYAVSLQTGERRLVAKIGATPPTEYLRDQTTGRVLAVETKADLPAWDTLEPAHPVAKVLDGLLAAFPGAHVRLVSRTEDDRLALAHVYSDRDPGRWFLVDTASLRAEPVVEERPWIAPAEMAEVEAFHIKASDGLRIHGYLTLPPGLAEGAKPPLVVLSHGGPHGERDVWGFDWEAQLLASQGFAVLQVNYRGSGGYGLAYQEAGYRHWGDRVMEDVLDATRWAIRKGKVDGARVCTYGASFGAYAAMQVASLAPELVRCAAGLAGVYDLTIMASRGDISWSGLGRGYVKRAVGDEEAALQAASPVNHPERLTVPVFLAHGGRDDRAPIAHAERLKDALTKLGRPPAWLEEPTEGHGFFDEKARLRFYERLVAFLKQHTAPRPAPAAQAAPPAAAAPAGTVPAAAPPAASAR